MKERCGRNQRQKAKHRACRKCWCSNRILLNVSFSSVKVYDDDDDDDGDDDDDDEDDEDDAAAAAAAADDDDGGDADDDKKRK